MTAIKNRSRIYRSWFIIEHKSIQWTNASFYCAHLFSILIEMRWNTQQDNNMTFLKCILKIAPCQRASVTARAGLRRFANCCIHLQVDSYLSEFAATRCSGGWLKHTCSSIIADAECRIHYTSFKWLTCSCAWTKQTLVWLQRSISHLTLFLTQS